MTNAEFKKLMDIQGGFTAKCKRGESVFGYSNIRTAYSRVMVMDCDNYYCIICNVETEHGNVYCPFGETTIKIRKSDNNLEAAFTVADEEGIFEKTTNELDNVVFSGYFSDVAKEYVKNLCELIFAVNKE